MSSAKEKAEARRKAILSRGKDRLGKLTSSARGEEALYMPEDPPLAPLPTRSTLGQFVGEESSLPTPPSLSRTASSSSRSPNNDASSTTSSGFMGAGFGDNGPDPSIWSEEQQQQLLQALMGGAGVGSPNLFGGLNPPQQQQQRRIPSNSSDPSSQSPPDDPLAALMQSLGQPGAQSPAGTFPGFPPPPAPPKPKTLLQKLIPLIHILAAWILLGYFVLWREPAAFETQSHGAGGGDWWRRWAELGWKHPGDGWGVQALPFFYAFTTLAIALHSWRIFSGLDPVQPPMLLSFALPHLPAPLPSIILNGLKYIQIAGVFFDDLSAVVVALGLLVWIANWVAQ
ncbi:hypothetical protein QCA50_008492 [Cerrena zonata]|uniref:Uncharacterized protein n=1 Tax=Cerrena zonata TaxID=2478898 RepID=A0AAW0GDY2_9APHY